MRRSLVMCVGLAGLFACTEILSPPPPDAYEYRQFEPDGAGGQRALAFHWPRSALPVSIYVAPGDPLESSLRLAISRWEATFLYGEWQGELVADSNVADIIVRNEVPAEFVREGIRLDSNAPQCRGSTDFVADVVAGDLHLPFRVYVWSRIGPTGEGLEECYDITTTHELGHALGIFAHSGNVDDLMFGDPVRGDLSDRDRATANAAYHRPATLAPVPR